MIKKHPKCRFMSNIIIIIFTMLTLISFLSLSVFAEDNAGSGDGSTGTPGVNQGYYRSGQFLWKVSLYVGNSDQLTTQSDISNFYLVGNQSVYIRPSSCTGYANAMYGAYNKVQYLSGYGLELTTSPNIVTVTDCPIPPVVYSSGNLDSVKSYFGDTNTMTMIIDNIAYAQGLSSYDLLSGLTITIGGRTQTGWSAEFLLPDGSLQNRVPWVVVYEPVIIGYLRDGSMVAFTATEYALAQINGYYNFCNRADNTALTPQYLQSLTRKVLPASVKLEESWFGFGTYDSYTNEIWDDTSIAYNGGWGMRWLPVSIFEPPYEPPAEIPEYGVTFAHFETPNENSSCPVAFFWRNYSSFDSTVTCEVYLSGTQIVYEEITIPAYDLVERTYSVYFSGTSAKTISAIINYNHMYEEQDYDNNIVSVTLTPIGSTIDKTYDFSLSDFSVSPDTVYQGNTMTVSFTTKNKNRDVGYDNIPIDILVDNVKKQTYYVNYSAGETKSHSFPILMDSSGTHRIIAVVNWFNLEFEDNQDDNSDNKYVTINPYYEFSISDLTVTPSTCTEGEKVTVTCKTDNWDKYNGYENIPVELLYNGTVLSTMYVSYVPYGANIHTFTVNVGSVIGTNTIIVRVNNYDRLYEVNPNNNTATTSVTVNKAIDLTIGIVIPNAAYNEGTEVITTYYVYNMSNKNIIPSNNNTVSFEAYYTENGNKYTFASMRKSLVVIPAQGSNIVYFKWKIPIGMSSKTVICKAVLNSTGSVKEANTGNNDYTFSPTIKKVGYMETPDTVYEEKPYYWSKPSNPDSIAGKNSWAEWQYEGGSFVKKIYGLSAKATAALTPDLNAFSSWQDNDEWYMRSGYGFSAVCTANISSLGSSYILPSSNAYTSAQNGNVYFPEFKYLTDINKYRTLELINGNLQFYENKNSVDDYRIHFTPVWTPNGTYTVSCKLIDLWTPAGMITTSGSGYLNIQGSMYNDWYVTHR